MAAHFVYLEDHALLFERVTGRFSLPETLQLYDNFGRDPRIAGTRLKLADLSGITEIAMSDAELGNLLDLIAGQYLRRLDSFIAGVLLASSGPGLKVAQEFHARLPQTIQPRFRQMGSVSDALAYLGLPPDTWQRLETPRLTPV